jgi:hypothetical protein
MPKRRWTVTVEFTTNDNRGSVSAEDAAEYVHDAVGSWHGQYMPDDPRMANVTNIAVKRVKNRPVR